MSAERRFRPFQSVLCPVDFSPSSRTILQHAAAIVERTGGRLTLLYVDDPLLAAAAAAGYDRRALLKTGTSELRRLLKKAGIDEAALEYAFGPPAREISTRPDV